MIIVCEPQCQAFSHEKFNSGFLYGLRLAFPQERIRFHGEASHIACLKQMLARDGASIENIDYAPIRFRTRPGIARARDYWRLLSNLLAGARAAGVDKVFFLSFNAEILFVLKMLKRKNQFRGMKFTLVLHGSFESVAGSKSNMEIGSPPARPGEKGLIARLRSAKPAELPAKLLRTGQRMAERYFSLWPALSRNYLTDRKMLLWRHSDDFHYICLSPHIRANAGQYLDVERLNFHTVTLPTIFAETAPRPRNSCARFAMFGYGNGRALRQLLSELSARDIKTAYEVRLIGMDTQWIDGFANATCPVRGKPLTRAEMDHSAEDIDMFLILYDKSRYRLSCSGSILEALAHLKPVLHLDNDCVNSFNKAECPIGVRCDSLFAMADKMQEIIEGYAAYGPVLDRYRENMLKVRSACGIEQSVPALRASFTWQNAH